MAKRKTQAQKDALEELAGSEFLKQAGVDPNEVGKSLTKKQIADLLTKAATDKDARERLQLLMRTDDEVRKTVESMMAGATAEVAPAPVLERKPMGKGAGKKELTAAQKAEMAASEERARAAVAAQAEAEAKALEEARAAQEAEKLRKLAEPVPEGPSNLPGREVVPEEVVAPQMPVAERKPTQPTMGPERAQKIREAFVARGVNPNILIERSTTGIKRLEDIPDTPEARAAINRMMNEEANTPGARARVRQQEAASKAAPGTAVINPTEAEKRQTVRKNVGRAEKATIFEQRAVPMGGVQGAPEVTETMGRTITNPLKPEEVRARNFARMDQRLKIKAADGILKGRVVMTNVEKAKLGEMVMLRNELRRVPEIAGGEKPPLLDELEQKLGQLEKEVAGAGRPNVRGVVGAHGRFFVNGKVRAGVMNFQQTGEVVRAKMAEEARAAAGPTMGQRLAQDPKELRRRGRLAAGQIRDAFGVRSNKAMEQVLKENGIIPKDAKIRRQEDIVKFLTKDKVDQLNALVKARREAGAKGVKVAPAAAGAEAVGEVAEEALPALETPAPATARAAARGAEAAPAAAAKTSAATAGVGTVAETAAAAAAPAAAGKMAAKKEVFGLRRSLQRLGKNAEAGMLKALRAQGVEITSLDQLPADRLDWARRWISGSGKGAGAAAKAAKKAGTAIVRAPNWTPGTPSPAAPMTAAPGGGMRMLPPGSGVPESKAITLYRPPTGAAAAAKTKRTVLSAAEAAARRKHLLEIVRKGGKFGRLASVGRFLGPAAAIFGMYQIADLIKQGTVDAADERRLKALQALGAVSGGMQQDSAMREQIRSMQRMVDLAAVQRRQALDEMNRQYTDDQALNALLSANQAQLASMSRPSQPSVAEMMARM